MRLLALLIGVLVLGGCVTKEIYNAQVIRTNNFQRQLAEEEKHSVDLAAEIARLKIQIAELEAQTVRRGCAYAEGAGRRAVIHGAARSAGRAEAGSVRCGCAYAEGAGRRAVIHGAVRSSGRTER